jgi:ribosome-associated protein
MATNQSTWQDDAIVISDNLAIPTSELQFRFTTGGGPGGQHVNKTATRVTIQFDIAGSRVLDEETRARLLDTLANRLDRQGVLQISVQDSRSQWQNRQLAIARLQALLRDALIENPERRPTKPGKAAKEKRLAEKRKQSAVKESRRRRWDEPG